MQNALQLMPQPGAGMTTLSEAFPGHRAVYTQNQFVAFRIGHTDDSGTGGWFASGATHTVRLRIRYLDKGTETITVTYKDGTPTEYTETIVTKGNTGKWRSAALTLAHVMRTGFGNYPDYNGADFLLASAGTLALNRVRAISTALDLRATWNADDDAPDTLLHQPDIDDFTNAGHTHATASQGGQLAQANTHQSPDTDSAPTSLHHTIGLTANQAAAGNHVHIPKGKSIVGGYFNAQIAASSTSYLNPEGGAVMATEPPARLTVPFGGIARNLYLRTDTAQPAGGTLTTTVFQNGAATPLAITIAANGAAGRFSDLTHLRGIAAGDELALRMSNLDGANPSATVRSLSLELDTPSNYIEKIIALFGASLLAFWPLNEASGTVAADASGNGRDAAYVSCTLGQGGVGDGGTSVLFDGVNSYVNAYSASLAAAFNGAAGTLFCFTKSAAWADANYHTLALFGADGSQNYIDWRKPNIANDLYGIYVAGNVTRQADLYPMSPTPGSNWIHWAMTWDKAADQIKLYEAGVYIQNGAPPAGLGTWVGQLSATLTTIGSDGTGVSNVYSGNMCHFGVMNRAATAAELLQAASLT